MLISDSHEFVFVHIRKAAGTSVRQLLERVSLPKNNSLWYKLLSRNGLPVDYHNYSFRKHANLVEAERSMPVDRFKRYFKFAIVRNPWDRLVSEFEYIKTQPSHSRHRKLSQMSFNEYISYQAKRPAAHQVNALMLKDGSLGCDYVGKLESLDASLAIISERIKLSITALPHINKINRKDYREYYDQASRDLVARLWQKDIAAFDYHFDPVD